MPPPPCLKKGRTGIVILPPLSASGRSCARYTYRGQIASRCCRCPYRPTGRRRCTPGRIPRRSPHARCGLSHRCLSPRFPMFPRRSRPARTRRSHVARDRYRAGIVGISVVPSHEIVLPERYGDKGRRASLRILAGTYHISHRLVCGIGRNRVQGYAGLPNVGEITPVLGLGIFRLTARRDIECHGIVVEGRCPYLGRCHGFGSHCGQTVAFGESRLADTFHFFANSYTLHLGTTVKCPVLDSCYGIAYRHCFQAGARVNA